MGKIKVLVSVVIIAVVVILSAKFYNPWMSLGLIDSSPSPTPAPAYNEELATILGQVRISNDAATLLNVPAGDFKLREWRYWYDPANHAIAAEILKTYGAITDPSPNPDVSGRTDLPRPSDQFVFSRFDVDQYTSSGRFQTVRDDYGNILEISIPFIYSGSNFVGFDCLNSWAKLNGVKLELSVKSFTTDVLMCGFSSSPSPTPVPTPTPTADIKANGSYSSITIRKNQSAIISWASSSVSICSVSPGGWTGTSNSGVSTGNLTKSTTYKLSCSGSYGSTSDSIKVNVSNR